MFTFSVIIPAYKRPAVLAETLDHLSAQTLGGRTLEVIVIDDDASAEVQTLVSRYSEKFGNVVYLSQPNEGQSRARNRGIAEARADLLFLTGDDILPEPDALQRHFDFHSKTVDKKVVALGKIDIDPRLSGDEFIHWLNNGGPQNSFHKLTEEGLIAPDLVEAAHVSLQRSDAVKFPFDERLRYFENFCWTQGLSRSGFKFYYLPAARSTHYHPVTLEQFGDRMFQIGKTLALLNREGRDYFRTMAGFVRPVSAWKITGYKFLGELFGSRKHLRKYWKSYLNRCQYRGFHAFEKGVD